LARADLDALARAAAGLRLEDVPEAPREHALRVLADTVGVIMAGARDPAVVRLVDGDGLLFRPSAAGPATILSPGLPGADPLTAAFVNGTAGTFLELDEGYRPTGHPSVHVLPAALAAAQALHRTGAELLAAYLSGYEVVARLFEAYRLRYPLHPHGHFGGVGAAVAVARLRGDDPAEPAAVASTLPILAVWQTCYEGATARNAYSGTASALGVLANRMAAAGFRGSREAQTSGFGELVGELVDPEVLAEPIDPQHPRILRDYLKLHSACALSHSALDAVLQLRPDPSRVERVEVETVANNLKLDRQAAANQLSTRFSLPYAVAAAIRHGHTRPDAFDFDPAVARLAERVTIRQAPDLEAAWPGAAPARVIVHSRGGTTTATVDNPLGHHSNPAPPERLREKFRMLVVAPDPDRLYDQLLGLEDVADCAELFAGVT
jgi:2-methylcitrate dehydratase PrpD